MAAGAGATTLISRDVVAVRPSLSTTVRVMVWVVSMESRPYPVSLDLPYKASSTLGCCQVYLTIVPSGSKESAPDTINFSPATTWSGIVILASGGLPDEGGVIGSGMFGGGVPLYVPAFDVKVALRLLMVPSAVMIGLVKRTTTDNVYS
ncbi:hypothetical protein D3C74_373920 [compost metagenome]